MTESEYLKLALPETGYDENGLICVIYLFQNRNNHHDMRYETAEGKKATKIEDNKYRVEDGRIITVP